MNDTELNISDHLYELRDEILKAEVHIDLEDSSFWEGVNRGLEIATDVVYEYQKKNGLL